MFGGVNAYKINSWRVLALPWPDPHLSRTVTVDGALTPTGPEDLDVWLHQGAASSDVYLVVDVLGSPARAMLPLTTAAAAAGALTQLIAQATTEGADRS